MIRGVWSIGRKWVERRQGGLFISFVYLLSIIIYICDQRGLVNWRTMGRTQTGGIIRNFINSITPVQICQFIVAQVPHAQNHLSTYCKPKPLSSKPQQLFKSAMLRSFLNVMHCRMSDTESGVSFIFTNNVIINDCEWSYKPKHKQLYDHNHRHLSNKFIISIVAINSIISSCAVCWQDKHAQQQTSTMTTS